VGDTLLDLILFCVALNGVLNTILVANIYFLGVCISFFDSFFFRGFGLLRGLVRVSVLKFLSLCELLFVNFCSVLRNLLRIFELAVVRTCVGLLV